MSTTTRKRRIGTDDIYKGLIGKNDKEKEEEELSKRFEFGEPYTIEKETKGTFPDIIEHDKKKKGVKTEEPFFNKVFRNIKYFLLSYIIFQFGIYFIRIFLKRWNRRCKNIEIGEEYELELKWKKFWFAFSDYSKAFLIILTILLLYYLFVISGIQKRWQDDVIERQFFDPIFIDYASGITIFNKYNPRYIDLTEGRMSTERAKIVINGTSKYENIFDHELKNGFKELRMRGSTYNVSIGEVINMMTLSEKECISAPNFGVPLNIILLKKREKQTEKGFISKNDLLMFNPNIIKMSETLLSKKVKSNIDEEVKSLIVPEKIIVEFVTKNGGYTKEEFSDNEATCIVYVWELANKIPVTKIN